MWRGHHFLHIQRIFRNTKEKMPPDQFCSHFYKKAQINLIPWLECCICIAVSVDTRIGLVHCHMAIWRYGHKTLVWPYGHIWNWPYGIEYGQYGCLLKQLYKCSTLVKELSLFDLFCRNGSKIGLVALFPLYFSENPLYMQKVVATPHKCPKTDDIFVGVS